jgi:hypothetical protein
MWLFGKNPATADVAPSDQTQAPVKAPSEPSLYAQSPSPRTVTDWGDRAKNAAAAASFRGTRRTAGKMKKLASHPEEYAAEMLFTDILTENNTSVDTISSLLAQCALPFVSLTFEFVDAEGLPGAYRDLQDIVDEQTKGLRSTMEEQTHKSVKAKRKRDADKEALIGKHLTAIDHHDHVSQINTLAQSFNSWVAGVGRTDDRKAALFRVLDDRLYAHALRLQKDGHPEKMTQELEPAIAAYNKLFNEYENLTDLKKKALFGCASMGVVRNGSLGPTGGEQDCMKRDNCHWDASEKSCETLSSQGASSSLVPNKYNKLVKDEKNANIRKKEGSAEDYYSRGGGVDDEKAANNVLINVVKEAVKTMGLLGFAGLLRDFVEGDKNTAGFRVRQTLARVISQQLRAARVAALSKFGHSVALPPQVGGGPNKTAGVMGARRTRRAVKHGPCRTRKMLTKGKGAPRQKRKSLRKRRRSGNRTRRSR